MKLKTNHSELKTKPEDLRKKIIHDDCEKPFTECVKDLLYEIKKEWEKEEHSLQFLILQEFLLKGTCDWRMDIVIQGNSNLKETQRILALIELKDWMYRHKGIPTFGDHMKRAFTELYDINHNAPDKSRFVNSKFYCFCRHMPDPLEIPSKDYKKLFSSIGAELYNYYAESEDFKNDITAHLKDVESRIKKNNQG